MFAKEPNERLFAESGGLKTPSAEAWRSHCDQSVTGLCCVSWLDLPGNSASIMCAST